jgi:hypothetical protein
MNLRDNKPRTLSSMRRQVKSLIHKIPFFLSIQYPISLLLIPLLQRTPAEVEARPREWAPQKLPVGGGWLPLERVLNTPFVLLTQTATLPFALSIEIRQNLGAC